MKKPLFQLCNLVGVCHYTINKYRFDYLNVLLHEVLVFQALLDVFNALCFGVDYITEFITAAIRHELAELQLIELQIEVEYVQWMYEVDESEAVTLLGLQIDWQVEVIIFALEVQVDAIEQVILQKPLGHIFHHYRGELLCF